MKMITAVVQEEDSEDVVHHLMQAGYYATKIGSTGGFLARGNVTLLMGVEDGEVEKVVDIVRHHCRQRMAVTKSRPPIQVRVGGAVIFIQDVVQCIRV